jgi:hypothetical protein
LPFLKSFANDQSLSFSTVQQCTPKDIQLLIKVAKVFHPKMVSGKHPFIFFAENESL